MLIGLVGDVHVKRTNAHEPFEKVRDILKAPDLLFGNLEGMYTDNPLPVPSALSIVHGPAHCLEVFPDVGFNVMSLANNHSLDAGYDALLETRQRLQARGVATCGAGENIGAARRAALLEADGIRIAFLAYSATFPLGCEARLNTPGIAPMRAHNVWREPFPTEHAPGLRPFAITQSDRSDLAALAEDIRQARATADQVIVSFHWGDPTRAFHLTDHETRTARYCIDQGAAMVVGHHHHTLRGVEWYRGKPILYGLGNFVFDAPVNWGAAVDTLMEDETELGSYFRQIEFHIGPMPGWPLFSYPPDARKTVLALARMDSGGVTAIEYLPCTLMPDGSVEPIDPGSAQYGEYVEYLERCNRSQRLKTRIVRDATSSIAGYPLLQLVPD